MSHGYPLQQTRGLAPVNHLCPCIDQHIIFKEAERGVGKIEKKIRDRERETRERKGTKGRKGEEDRGRERKKGPGNRG